MNWARCCWFALAGQAEQYKSKENNYVGLCTGTILACYLCKCPRTALLVACIILVVTNLILL
jgi:hypothetical protein